MSQYGTSFYADSTINASFYDSPYSGHNTINAGTVSVNNSTLYVYPNYVYHNTNNINFNSLSWQISGNK
ncbi:MAG: hypothetical protein LCH32_13870 [Bacteroidetes bacterium]|nr:hypothetical protein [Bacteroidota bacterium]